MNRIIKFRAWDKEEKKYYYNVQDAYDFGNKTCNIHEDNFGDVLRNDNYIVEQFTGLHDKNGKEIYENDLLGHKLNRVIMLNGSWCANGDRELSSLASYNEVIGNIHE